jgi:hypothetical protein
MGTVRRSSWAGALVLAAAVGEAALAVAPLEIPRISNPPVIDGILDDPAWQGPPLELGEWLTYNPLNGERLPQKTEVWAAYDASALYFAFRCLDPEPDKIRANLSRRDQLWSDDWVGLGLDAAGTGQSSYDFFVNARGIQGDILNTSSAGENTAPDFYWQSAGRRTPEGYVVEIRLPLKTLRFRSGDEVRMGILFWRRVSRLGMSASWPPVPAGKSFFESHASLLLRDLRQPLVLELIPSLTYSWDQVRQTPERFSPADDRPDAGVSLKYGLTSSTALEGTFNPDFSQVESDAFQVEVNQRFPVFFSEKRPFFMEGMGTFELAGTGGDAMLRTAVHTRRIVDPRWGAKLSGTLGRVTFASLLTSDEAPGRAQNGLNGFPGQNRRFQIGRAVWSLGKRSYVGALLTNSERALGHNRVAGADLSLRKGGHSGSATLLATASRELDGSGPSRGFGGQASYVFENRRFVFANQLEHYDREFRMDTAFLNQNGITSDWAFAAWSFYPDAQKHPWVKRVVPFVFARAGRDRLQEGDDRFVLPGVRFHFTRQGFFRVDTGWGREPWAGEGFSTRVTRVMGEAQILRWLSAFGRVTFGRSVFYDPESPFLGRSRSYNGGVTLQPSASFKQELSWQRVSFDRLGGGTRVFDVDVLNLRTSYQFDRHLLLRGIVRWDSSRREVLTDVLASFELVPGTVAYLGYGSLSERREWDGAAWRLDEGRYLTVRRGLFFKASYVHRF